MQFQSTRDPNIIVSSSEAILRGLAPDGGLFVPTAFPKAELEDWKSLSYPELAQKVLAGFLTDYNPAFLGEAAAATYGDAFAGKAGYVQKVHDGLYSLELWHGPTCAFKDYALQLMPKLLVQAKKNLGRTETTRILVATSGDTGKAALAGYAGLPGIEIEVFYPDAGTSEIQRLQMATQAGDNVSVYAVNGNFDDAQTGVKRVFGDASVAEELEKRNICLSSANSINWGRLVPQIVYYFYAYFRLVDEAATLGVSVPIVPGIMPITSSSQLIRFSDACGAEIPRWIRLRLQSYGDDVASIKAFGHEVVADLCERLLEGGAPSLHFYTMNQAGPTTELCKAIGA